MPRKKKRRFQQEKTKAQMEMTPMIDVTFQLLIFFMLTIKFKVLEGKLAAYLPKDVGVNTTDAEPKEKTDIRLVVIKEGTKLHPRKEEVWSGVGAFRYGPDRVVEYSVGPKKYRDLDSLRRRLVEVYESLPPEDAATTIDPSDRGIVYADVIGVLDAALLAGFTDVTFKGAPPPRQ